ncbi:MAG: RNA polymerase subunit sigma-70 [Acidimicrobiaceae bacterium]|nr:RNA polymerase subunit sigma-70 [Acidimicrobiaceae bacterium]
MTATEPDDRIRDRYREAMDAAAFEDAFARHRHELHVHCYRMTGSFWDAEELTQLTFERAWRNRSRFEHRASTRTWLYKIATNACLDHLKQHERRTSVAGNVFDILERNRHLQPYPDGRATAPGGGEDPADTVAARETTEMFFVAALTALSPRQRAVLIATELLGWSAADAAELIDTSVPATNSLLQRARTRMRRTMTGVPRPSSDAIATELLAGYVEAHEQRDVARLERIIHHDIRISMPPEPACVGRAAALAFFERILVADGSGDWKLVPTSANGRPAALNYLRLPDSDTFAALSIDVLHIRDDRLAAINCFLDARLARAFGHPLAID